MDTNEVVGQGRMNQFRDLSDTDKNVIKRLTMDRTKRALGPDANKLDLSPISGVFRRTLRDATDIRNIFQIMPDLHLPREILISAIMSPGDLAQQTLIFGNEMEGCESAMLSPLTNALEQFFSNTKKIPSKVAEWADDALIWSGAHPILIIPEATLDRLVLGEEEASMESISSYGGEFVDGWYKPKGIFGLSVPTSEGEGYVSLESAQGRLNSKAMLEYHTIKHATKGKRISLPFRVTDNMAVLRTPAVAKLKRSRLMENAYGTPSLESRKRQRKADKAKAEGTSDNQVFTKFYRQPQKVQNSRLQMVQNTTKGDRTYGGHPLEYHLATEAVMPVCVPGDESNHVGYIILLDANGYPISYSRRLNYYDDVRRNSMAGADNAGSAGAVAGELINMSKDAIVGGVANASNSQIDRLAELHAQILDADIVARLKNGMLGGDFELSHTEHVDRLMFARSMKNQLTTMLYVPAELMIYMAFEYNEYGIGKSILEDAKSLAAMRGAVTVAQVIGATKNAIPGKDINITLPEDDGDPLGTATFMANEALGLAYHQFPMAISSAAGLAEQLQLSSMNVNVKNNPRFPEIEAPITPRESSYAQIDSDLVQQLRDDLTRVFGLTPEMVDSVNQPDFATTAVQNSLMLQKRVMVIQAKLNPMITDYVRVFTYNSGILITELLELIEQNAKFLPDDFKDDPEGFLEEFLNNLIVELPKPESDNLTKQMELFNNFSETLDKALPAYLREEYFDGYSPDEIKEALPTAIESWKGVILRDWMRKRGILRELDVFSTAEDGSPVMNLTEEMSNHIENVMKTMGGFMKRVAHDAIKRKKLTGKTFEEVDKAQKMLEEIRNRGEDQIAEDDPYGGGQDLAAGNVPTPEEPQLDEDGNPIEPTDGDAATGGDEFSMDLGAPEGDETQNDNAPPETGEPTVDGEPPAEPQAAASEGDDLSIDLGTPEGSEATQDAPTEPDAAAAPAEEGSDLSIDLGTPESTEEQPAEADAGADTPAEEPAAADSDLSIDLGNPEDQPTDTPPAEDGGTPPVEETETADENTDLKIDLGDEAEQPEQPAEPADSSTDLGINLEDPEHTGEPEPEVIPADGEDKPADDGKLKKDDLKIKLDEPEKPEKPGKDGDSGKKKDDKDDLKIDLGEPPAGPKK